MNAWKRLAMKRRAARGRCFVLAAHGMCGEPATHYWVPPGEPDVIPDQGRRLCAKHSDTIRIREWMKGTGGRVCRLP